MFHRIPRLPSLPSLPYFVDGGRSGCLAEDRPDSLAEAVLAEIKLWKTAKRDAGTIAQTWRERVTAEAVMKQTDDLLFQAVKSKQGEHS